LAPRAAITKRGPLLQDGEAQLHRREGRDEIADALALRMKLFAQSDDQRYRRCAAGTPRGVGTEAFLDASMCDCRHLHPR
jgi:hypothetical protein